jgi:hypothetical protein
MTTPAYPIRRRARGCDDCNLQRRPLAYFDGHTLCHECEQRRRDDGHRDGRCLVCDLGAALGFPGGAR